MRFEIKKEKRNIYEQTFVKAFSVSFIRGKTILRINILGFIIVYHNNQIDKVGFIKRKKVLELV